MDRRGFLKVITALGASVALPVGNTTVAEAATALLENATPLGLMREIYQYSLHDDMWYLRYDICTGVLGRISSPGDIQLTVDMRYNTEEELKDDLSRAREIAKDAFTTKLSQEGISWSEVKPMPKPFSYAR